jgi:hypothetical protein
LVQRWIALSVILVICTLAIYIRSFSYLGIFDITNPWRVETKRPIMEEAPKWLEHDVDELEEEKVSEDVPLPRETNLEH